MKGRSTNFFKCFKQANTRYWNGKKSHAHREMVNTLFGGYTPKAQTPKRTISYKTVEEKLYVCPVCGERSVSDSYCERVGNRRYHVRCYKKKNGEAGHFARAVDIIYIM